MITQFRHTAAVTPSDAADLPGGPCAGIYVGTTGDVAITDNGGTDSTLHNVVAGTTHPISVRRIRATGTSAANIKVFYP